MLLKPGVPPPLQAVFHLLFTLIADYSVVCANIRVHGELLSDLICQLVHHFGKQDSELMVSYSKRTTHYCLAASSYMSRTNHTFSVTPHFLIRYHSSSLQTLSYAFSRSTKTQYNSFFPTALSKQKLHLPHILSDSVSTSHFPFP